MHSARTIIASQQGPQEVHMVAGRIKSISNRNMAKATGVCPAEKTKGRMQGTGVHR